METCALRSSSLICTYPHVRADPEDSHCYFWPTLGHCSLHCQLLDMLAAQTPVDYRSQTGFFKTGPYSFAHNVSHNLSMNYHIIQRLPWPPCLSLCQWPSLAVTMATALVLFGTNKTLQMWRECTAHARSLTNIHCLC